MNRLTILITALLVAMVTQAGVVTIDEARQKAQLFKYTPEPVPVSPCW